MCAFFINNIFSYLVFCSIDSDMNGINASVWQDLPLEMDDKNPIVLIAKPFTQLNVEAADRTSNGTGFFKNTSDVRMNQTEDFFASVSATATPFAASNQLRGVSGGTFTNESNESSQLESGSFGNYNFANFRKKFFSRIVPL